MDEDVSPETQTQCCRGRYDSAGSYNPNRKKCRFWKKFSPVCVRKQKQARSDDAPPERALQAPGSKGQRRRRLIFQTWPRFDKFLTRRRFKGREEEEESLSAKKLQWGRGESPGEGRSLSVGQTEDFLKHVINEGEELEEVEGEEEEELHRDILTVMAEMSGAEDTCPETLPNTSERRPGGPPEDTCPETLPNTSERRLRGSPEDTCPETLPNTSERRLRGSPEDTCPETLPNTTSERRPRGSLEDTCPETLPNTTSERRPRGSLEDTCPKTLPNTTSERRLCGPPEQDFIDAGDVLNTNHTDAVTDNNSNDDITERRDSAGAMLDSDDFLSTSTGSSEDVFEVPVVVKTSHAHEPLSNGRAVFQYNLIRIELVPPESDDHTQEDGGWENQNHCQRHLLPVFSYSESQLVQTARGLVQTAMRAAMDQLTREQQSGSAYIHRLLTHELV